ncbi:histidine kinase dimerization/phospho-acceptor domain-containing protein [Methylobacterium oryzihabitans]|uniref:histidine kinase dimerization/phospho-acceptor domain-containing protein n=1 Tax=Methylobacterium oryzihabitans TaxID=2499852 RepID=UPI001FED0B8C|nr:histidine kinase dimerization/phospho-acceptor domain-containing protein [Methylobacterium oryzihabitans]
MDGNERFATVVGDLRILREFGGSGEAPGRPILLLDHGCARLLHATPEARVLAGRIGDAEGRIDPALALPRQLRAAAAAAPEGARPRLDRLRLDASRLAPPLLCASLPVRLPEGGTGIAVAVVDPLPAARPRRPLPASEPVPPAAPETVAPAPGRAPSPPERLAGRGPVRFLWRSDADGRLTEAGAPFGELIGRGALGQSWRRLLAGAVVSPDGSLAEALERRRTFRAIPVSWRLDDAPFAVTVDLSGAPRLGEGRAFAGFGGFGVIHADRVAPAPPADPRSTAAPPQRPSLRERAAAVIAFGRSEDGTAASPVRPPSPPARPAPADLPAFATLAGATMADFANIVVAPLTQLGLGWGFGLMQLDADRPAPLAGSGPAPSGTAQAPPADPPEAAVSAAEAAPAAAAEPAAEPPAPPAPDPLPAPAVEAVASGPSAAEAAPPDPRQLSMNEHAAFREIARALGARFAGDRDEAAPDDAAPEPPTAGGAVMPFRSAGALARQPDRTTAAPWADRLIDRLPVGVLVHRGDEILLANRTLLTLTGYDSPASLAAAGGPGALFKGREPASLPAEEETPPLCLARREGGAVPVQVVVAPVDVNGSAASLLTVRLVPDADEASRLAAAETGLAASDGRLREIQAVLDAVADGIVILDGEGRILSLNRGATALLGFETREVAGDDVGLLFTAESRVAARAALHRARGGSSGEAEEVIGQARDGTLPLLLSVSALAAGDESRFAVVLRDVSDLKRTERDLARARRDAERASNERLDFLATVSHEVRTPLNAIIGFAEMMLDEQYGPLGSDRYRDYLRDIRVSGEHVVGLVDDLLDLARIEAGRIELSFAGLVLNDLVAECVALMQPLAARQRVVVRTSFSPALRPVLADARSLRQATMNVIANAITYTEAGGQVIVSTAETDRGGVALRVRDTGIGMTLDEIDTALQPFRRPGATPLRGGAGTGLGLPLTRALVEANRGVLRLTSQKGEGTLVEILFPSARVLDP